VRHAAFLQFPGFGRDDGSWSVSTTNALRRRTVKSSPTRLLVVCPPTSCVGDDATTLRPGTPFVGTVGADGPVPHKAFGLTGRRDGDQGDFIEKQQVRQND